jgi:hypothetical protein
MYLTGVREQLKGFVKGLEPGVYDSIDATRMVGELAEIERLAATGKALLAARVADSGTLRARGERSVASWLAKVSGTSVGEAAGALATVESLPKLPHTDQALREGKISPAQARQIAEGSVNDPSAEWDLLGVAQSGSLNELRDAARRTRAAGEDDRARYARVRAKRYFKHRVEVDGAFTGSFSLTPDDGAELLAAVRPFRDAAFDHARTNGRREPLEAYAADGLVGLARWYRTHTDGDAAAPGGVQVAGEVVPVSLRPSRDAKIIVRVDAAALQRGHTEAGEICDIAGIGPVPVAVVYSLLPQALAAAVITNGQAVATVAHAGRQVTATQLTALQWQGIQCEVDGCDAREHLEIDHLIDYAITKHTRLAELGYKCRLHHDLKTYQGWDYIAGTTHLVAPHHACTPTPKPATNPTTGLVEDHPTTPRSATTTPNSPSAPDRITPAPRSGNPRPTPRPRPASVAPAVQHRRPFVDRASRGSAPKRSNGGPGWRRGRPDRATGGR